MPISSPINVSDAELEGVAVAAPKTLKCLTVSLSLVSRLILTLTFLCFIFLYLYVLHAYSFCHVISRFVKPRGLRHSEINDFII